MARKPDEADAGFAIGVYEQGIIESNADDRFGRSGDPEDRKWAEEEGLFNSDSGTREGTITEKGWDLLNDDVAKIEKNAMVWMKRKFLDARDEGHSDDLVGTFWFDPKNPDHAQLVDLAADTGRQERIDMVDLSYGDLAHTAFDGVSDFGGMVLGGGITFFDVKPEDMEVIEQTLEVQRRGSQHARETARSRRPLQRGQRARENPKRKHYEVTANDDVIYSGDSLRDAQDRFDDAAHRNYEGSGYVDWVIEIKENGRVLRSFGPNDHRPHYFHPLPRWIDKGVTETRRLPARPTRRRPPPARRR